ncbi:MAG TPA: acetate--CoA ligase family protein [Solirubrobacteraceae bacterium]|nr:acetate--CoA ligase family protein [Solirubrobacteraceae bacterium]
MLDTAEEVSLNATFTAARVRPGPLAICSQSGAVGIGLLGHAAARRLGVSTFASLGNRADISTNDLLEWWEQDERTAAVILYVDTFGNPEHFTRIARRVSRQKPILALKGRRSNERRTSEARSHTAAAIRADVVVDALFHQAGVLRFRAGEELFDAAEFFERQPLPDGRRIGIISNSAGVARLAADACAVRGLEVRQVEGAKNPLVLAVSASPDEYATSIHALLGHGGIDALMVYYVDVHDGRPDAILDAICAAADGRAKPVVASVVRSDGRPRPRTTAGVPNFLFPESCADVLARAAERREWLSRPLGEAPYYPDLARGAAREVITGFLDRGSDGGWLSLVEAESLLVTHGIPIYPSHFCASVDGAVAVAAELGVPVALKANLAAPEDAGDIDAVLRELNGETAVREGWRELERRVRRARREWQGAIIQRAVAPGGADVLVGVISDPDLGPVLAVGLGGRHAGLGSAAFRLLPTTDAEADELIDSSPSVVTELDGFRSGALLDREALRELILRFALLLREAPEVVEGDLNPIRCMTRGCAVLDMRLRIERRRPIERVKTW